MNKIIVYSTNSCPYCVMAKEYLKSKNIEFEDVDVAQDPNKAMEMIRKSGQQGVPVLDVNGKIIIGFNRPEIDSALK
jgi:glutaredoxin 3